MVDFEIKDGAEIVSGGTIEFWESSFYGRMVLMFGNIAIRMS